MEKLTKALVVVSGRVQGVFYRQSTKDRAQALGLTGWVKNLPDGAVALEAVGPREAVDSLILWCWQGPPSAHVKNVDVQWADDTADSTAHAGFHIVR